MKMLFQYSHLVYSSDTRFCFRMMKENGLFINRHGYEQTLEYVGRKDYTIIKGKQ